MIQVNFLKQIETLFNIFINNKYVLYLGIISLVSLFALISACIIKNKKITKILLIIIYLGVFGTLFYFYNKEIFAFIDYLINNIFLFLFFPNLAIYSLVILITNIFIVKSIISKKDKLGFKIYNILSFILFNIIFYLIIDNVIKNKINVYEQLSIYTNSDLLILIQLSMNLFIVWIIILIITKLTNRMDLLFSHKYNKKVVFDNTINTLELENIEPIPEKKSKLVFNDIVVNAINENIKKVNNYVEINKIDVISNVYNSYVDISPIKKKDKNKEKVLLSSMENLFKDDINIDNHDMDILFGNKNCLEVIMSDIEKLRYNQKDVNQIRKIYEEISLNQNELSLNDYNYLINALIDIKENN